MTTIIYAALIALGVVVGYIIAWVFRAGTPIGILTGLWLVVAGAVIGFVVEWFIDEAYRRNRELQEQIDQHSGSEPPVVNIGNPPPSHNNDKASEALTEILHQRDHEVNELRNQISETDAQIESLREQFETYQRTHPDEFTTIKGIGPVYQRKLRDIGIGSYDQLAKADPDRVRRMLDVKKWQRVDIESWVEQARDWAQRSQ
jgi:predicted flap endonuclease-1-like 5' DNA nuclease